MRAETTPPRSSLYGDFTTTVTAVVVLVVDDAELAGSHAVNGGVGMHHIGRETQGRGNGGEWGSNVAGRYSGVWRIFSVIRSGGN